MRPKADGNYFYQPEPSPKRRASIEESKLAISETSRSEDVSDVKSKKKTGEE